MGRRKVCTGTTLLYTLLCTLYSLLYSDPGLVSSLLYAAYKKEMNLSWGYRQPGCVLVTTSTVAVTQLGEV